MWYHVVQQEDYAAIKSGDFPCQVRVTPHALTVVSIQHDPGRASTRWLRQGAHLQVIHGRHDIVAPPKYGERLAARMACPCITLEGAHFLTRERGPAINALLRHIIMPNAAKVNPSANAFACESWMTNATFIEGSQHLASDEGVIYEAHVAMQSSKSADGCSLCRSCTATWTSTWRQILSAMCPS